MYLSLWIQLSKPMRVKSLYIANIRSSWFFWRLLHEVSTKFDGSSSLYNGISIQPPKIVMPKFQEDLISLLHRFRMQQNVVCAEMEKMYGMVLIDPKQRCLQRIYWRNFLEELELEQLRTETLWPVFSRFVRCNHS